MHEGSYTVAINNECGTLLSLARAQIDLTLEFLLLYVFLFCAFPVMPDIYFEAHAGDTSKYIIICTSSPTIICMSVLSG